MYLVDTNIHAAFLLQDYEGDELTKQYLELFVEISLADRVVSDFILGEFETFIMQVVPSRYKLKPDYKKKLKQLALDYIERLTSECTVITPDVQTVQRARDIYFEYANTHYMSFIDCLILATAKHNNYTLFTKDRRMITIAKKLEIPCHEPPT